MSQELGQGWPRRVCVRAISLSVLAFGGLTGVGDAHGRAAVTARAGQAQTVASLATAAAKATKKPPPVTTGIRPTGGHSNPLWNTRAQRLYGGDLDAFKHVVWQPDVVRIPAGANAIRGISANGLTWTLAGAATGVSRLRPGVIMAATTQALGRVEAVRRHRRTVAVTLGPVDLPDVFRKADFSGHDVPLTHPLYDDDTLSATPSGAAAPHARSPFDKKLLGGVLRTGSICCTGGIGEYWRYDHPQGRLFAQITMLTPKPTVDFDIVIDNGLRRASLKVHGATGLTYDLTGATKTSKGDFSSGLQTDPISVTVPVGPAQLTITQSFYLNMALAGAAYFKAQGEYTLKGDLGFTYDRDAAGPKTRADALVVGTQKNIFEHNSWLGEGLNALILSYKLRGTIGIGLGGFSAGAYVALAPSLGILENSVVGSPKNGCLKGTLSLATQWGVGYTIPAYALKFINKALGVVGAKPIGPIGGKPLGNKTLLNIFNKEYCPS